MAQNDRTTGLVGNSAAKVPCKAASTGVLVLSGEQNVDGVALVTGDRVLVKNQASSVDNGIYVVDTGAWSRAKDADGTYDWVKGSAVYVHSGTVSAGLFYTLTAADPITVGTTALTFAVINPGSTIAVPVSTAQGGTGGTSAISGLANLGVVQVTAEAGTANVQTGTVDALVTAYRADQIFEYIPNISNTAACTLTLTPQGGVALAAMNVFANGAACVGGELVAGVPNLLHCDGARLNIIGQTRVGGMLTTLGAGGLLNGYLAWTVAGNVLTVAVKTIAGADPSAADPVFYPVRDVTAATGSPTYRKLTAALSATINNTALMGTVNAISFRLWGAIFNDGGTDRLAIINCVSSVAGAGSGRDVTAIYPLAGWGIASATLSDNASDNSQVFYANAAIAAKAYTTVGYATWETGLAAAGVWSAAPTRAQLFGPGVPLPGQLIQPQRNDLGTSATGTTVVPADNTIPQITEGDQYMTQPVTPSSAANVLCIYAASTVTNSAAPNNMSMSLYQDTTANALKTAGATITAATQLAQLNINHMMLALLSVATTFRIRAGGNSAGTTTFNGSGGAQLYGAVLNSFVEVREVMG